MVPIWFLDHTLGPSANMCRRPCMDTLASFNGARTDRTAQRIVMLKFSCRLVYCPCSHFAEHDYMTLALSGTSPHADMQWRCEVINIRDHPSSNCDHCAEGNGGYESSPDFCYHAVTPGARTSSKALISFHSRSLVCCPSIVSIHGAAFLTI